MKKTTVRILLVAATLAIGIVLGLRQIAPPSVDQHSAMYPAYERMMDNIQRLAVEPHPSGSDAIDVVRAALLSEITDMGLTPIVEEVPDRMVFMQNILVKIDAPGNERGILFVSHYDSVPRSPGAADDMLSVCAMLEAMRAHAENDALQSDLYFLFTDGEEIRMLGARAFVNAHPELKDAIGMVVNLEARGNRGALLLFETSPKAYPLLQTVLRSGAKPVGFSWAAAVYEMMPNYTDFTAFLEHGYQGINLAAIEGAEHYHQPTDTFDNIDRSTAWHYLHTTLALADYAANNPLDGLRAAPSEAVYFPFLPGNTVLISGVAAYVLCAAACALALAFGVMQAKNRRLKVSFSTVLMALLVLLSIGSAIFFIAGSYLFVIPLLAMAVTSFLKKWPVAHTVAQMASGVVALLLWVPSLYLLWVSLIA